MAMAPPTNPWWCPGGGALVVVPLVVVPPRCLDTSGPQEPPDIHPPRHKWAALGSTQRRSSHWRPAVMPGQAATWRPPQMDQEPLKQGSGTGELVGMEGELEGKDG